MTQRERPLAPFMLGPYYKPQITSVMSFMHRATGVALAVGLFVLLAWLAALAHSQEAYENVTACLGSLPGRIVLAAFVFALVYHFFNGIRHLAWDLGYGLSLKGAYTGGMIVAVLAAVFTAALWYFGFSAGGAA